MGRGYYLAGVVHPIGQFHIKHNALGLLLLLLLLLSLLFSYRSYRESSRKMRSNVSTAATPDGIVVAEVVVIVTTAAITDGSGGSGFHRFPSQSSKRTHIGSDSRLNQLLLLLLYELF